jgi:hypothetical protein
MAKWLNALALEEKKTLVKFDHPFMQVVCLTIVIQKNLFDATIKGH